MIDPQPGLQDVQTRHGSARRPRRSPVHRVPDGVPDDLVVAVGELSAALETVEVARGHLYAFHRYSGTADRELGEAVDALRAAGRADVADVVEDVLRGRDVVDDHWTFEIVERYDRQYWSAFRDVEAAARAAVGLDAPHVFEAGMKHDEQESR